MSTAAPPHRPCQELERGAEGLADDAVHRFLLGQDEKPQQLSAIEATAELDDPFARLLLHRGVFPRTAGAVLDGILAAAAPDDPLRTHRFFLVGEGSQIPHVPGAPPVARNLRFLVTCGRGPDGPDVMVSAFHPDQDTVEVMAWDRRSGGFNFFRTVGPGSAWVFAGNSRHALTAPTRGNGPFESHASGHFLMKELRKPWVNWHSPLASVESSVLTAQGLQDHPWVRRLEPGGAYTLEDEVALPSIQRWTRARLDALLSGTSPETPRRLLEQLLDTPTVNLVSSRTSSGAAVAGTVPTVDLPATFFAHPIELTDELDLAPPPQFFVAAGTYAESLRAFEVTLTDGRQFTQPGDTHFAFVVPERAFEDTETVRQAIDRGVIGRRLAACLLMVDFPNPVFSERRRALLRHVPDGPSTPDFSDRVSDAIRNAPDAAVPGSPEHEFTERWNAGEAFTGPFDGLLQAYYSAVGTALQGRPGFDDYLRLAESRRAQVKQMPIRESELLFARTTVPPGVRVMAADGTVREV